MTPKEFKEQVFEIAFGDNAINREFSDKEVLEKLREFSDNALKYEESKHGNTESELEICTHEFDMLDYDDGVERGHCKKCGFWFDTNTGELENVESERTQ